MNPFFSRTRVQSPSRSSGSSPDSSPEAFPDLSSGNFDNASPSNHDNVVRIMSPAGERLSVIVENGALAPPKIPPRSPNRLRSSSGSISQATVLSSGSNSLTPDEKVKNWSIWSDDGREDPEPPLGRFARLQQNRHIARRGGWRRLALCILLFLVVIAAIVAGILVGTRRHKDSSSSGQASTQSQGNARPSGATTIYVNTPPTATGSVAGPPTGVAIPVGFPLGSYSIRTFLDTVITDCTSNPTTWTCYPYATLNDSPVKTLTTFNWVISQTADKKSFLISSTPNPFAITFANMPLTLVDAGQPSERYRFQTTMDKEVRPSSNLTADNAATTCYYNGTTFTGTLYTKVAATYPSERDGSAAAANSSTTPNPVWPFQVRVEQDMASGSSVPNCYKLNNGVVGDKAPVSTGASGALCSCLYRNTYVPAP